MILLNRSERQSNEEGKKKTSNNYTKHQEGEKGIGEARRGSNSAKNM